jgi:peptidase M23-like protein/transglycosylase-like protein with SLT domain
VSAARFGQVATVSLAITGAGLLASAALFVVLFAALGGTAPALGEALCGTSSEAQRAIPNRYVKLYQDAGEQFGLDWALLAAIGQIESGHGRNVGPSSAGALGPMQFLPATWSRYGIDGNGDGVKDVLDPEDAIPGAAQYLRASGAPANWRGALFAYNHADWYVNDVLAQGERYRGRCITSDENWEGGDGRLAWPIRGTVTSPFGLRWGRPHEGIDIAAPGGTPIHASGDGVVVLRAPVAGYGNYICLRHDEHVFSCYAHLSAYRASRGDRILRGDVIGLVGCTGRCFGDHLHFEVRLGGAGGKAVDPIQYLAP